MKFYVEQNKGESDRRQVREHVVSCFQALLIQNVNSGHVLKSYGRGLPSNRGGRGDSDRGRGRGRHSLSYRQPSCLLF